MRYTLQVLQPAREAGTSHTLGGLMCRIKPLSCPPPGAFQDGGLPPGSRDVTTAFTDLTVGKYGTPLSFQGAQP